MAHVVKRIEIVREAADYESEDDSLAAAAEDVAQELGVEVWQCEARWADDARCIADDRIEIIVEVGLHEDDVERLEGESSDREPADLVLCESADGWSFHAPDSTDEDIASGDAPYITTGEGRATKADRAEAFRIWASR